MTNKTSKRGSNPSPELELEAFKQHVLRQEFSAREAKAVYETFHYTIEADKLRETYNDVMQVNAALRQKHMEELERLKEQAIFNTQLMGEPIAE